jgi:hypothetical protein
MSRRPPFAGRNGASRPPRLAPGRRRTCAGARSRSPLRLPSPPSGRPGASVCRRHLALFALQSWCPTVQLGRDLHLQRCCWSGRPSAPSRERSPVALPVHMQRACGCPAHVGTPGAVPRETPWVVGTFWAAIEFWRPVSRPTARLERLGRLPGAAPRTGGVPLRAVAGNAGGPGPITMGPWPDGSRTWSRSSLSRTG